MNTGFIKILLCVLLVSATLFTLTFVICSKGNENESNVQSETSNPYGESFTPAPLDGTSLYNAASEFQTPPFDDFIPLTC